MINNPGLHPNRAPPQLFPVPSKAGNLITAVDRCWVCDAVFKEYGGTGAALVQEFHHPVPRSFGGSSGPTVSLCSAHHALAHDLSLRLKSNRPYSLERDSIVNARLLVLANIIVNAMNAFKEDPNRSVPVGLSIPSALNEQIKLLARSNRMSATEFIKQAIVREVQRQMPVIKRDQKC